MKVEDLKEELQNALDYLEDFEDDEEIDMVSNTYFLGDTHIFVGVSGYDGGYFNLRDIKVKEKEDEEGDSE